MKKKIFCFCILMFVELKCISGEPPILADLEYIMCFKIARLHFAKMNALCIQLTKFVFLAKCVILQIDGG